MGKKARLGEVARDLMRERLRKHLDEAEATIRKWQRELHTPPPFVIGGSLWPYGDAYTPISEKNSDTIHIIRCHLRSRALWANHTQWIESVGNLEEIGTTINKMTTRKAPSCSKAYIESALWAAYRTVTHEKVENDYRWEERRGITFYGIVIDETGPSDQTDEVVRNHMTLRLELTRFKEFADFEKKRADIQVLEERMQVQINKMMMSGDIFYPCRFCKRLMEA